MRKYIPLIIVLAAFALYEGRGAFLGGADSRLGAPDGQDAAMATANRETAARSTVNAEDGRATQVRNGSISKGASFFVEMQQAGVSPPEIHEVVEASKRLFNFRRVRPGQKFSLFTAASGELDSLHFAIDTASILKVARDGTGTVVARLDTIPYSLEHYVTTGTIQSSIYEALVEQEANPELASYLAVIFQWDIDFFKDIRKGDTFTILYQNKVFEGGRRELGNVLAARVYTQGREHYAFAYTKENGSRSYYDLQGKSLQKSLLRAPLRYRRISSNFTHKRLHPVTRKYKPHLGVDYVAPVGTPVRATGDGRVVAATRERANGNYVKIRHNSRYTTYYLHLRGFAKGIRAGTRVKQGQVIGYLGSTGLVTAPHLDYRIKVNGRFVNPRTVRLPSKEPVPANERGKFWIVRDSYLLRFFDGDANGATVAVNRPAPPLQSRLAMVF